MVVGDDVAVLADEEARALRLGKLATRAPLRLALALATALRLAELAEEALKARRQALRTPRSVLADTVLILVVGDAAVTQSRGLDLDLDRHDGGLHAIDDVGEGSRTGRNGGLQRGEGGRGLEDARQRGEAGADHRDGAGAGEQAGAQRQAGGGASLVRHCVLLRPGKGPRGLRRRIGEFGLRHALGQMNLWKGCGVAVWSTAQAGGPASRSRAARSSALSGGGVAG